MARSRVRSRSSHFRANRVRKIYTNTGVLYSTTNSPVDCNKHLEEFRDVTGASDKVKPCYHASWTVDSYPRPNLNQGRANTWFEVNTDWYTPFSTTDVEPLFPGPSQAVRTEMADKAFLALVPQVPQEVSIPNFLYELRELGGLIPSVQKNMANTVSGGYLSYQFGWKPMVQDIIAIRNLMDTIRTRLEYLRDTYGRETRLSFSAPFEVNVDTPTVRGEVTRLSYRGIFRCGGYLYHKLNDLDGTIGEFRALTAATGFNNPLGVIWEAIPFSFLLDWFGRAGSLIQRQALQPFTGEWGIRRLTHSYEWSGEFEGVEIFPAGSLPSKWKFWHGKYSGYTRDVGLPVSSSFLWNEDLSPQQQLLALALLGATVK